MTGMCRKYHYCPACGFIHGGLSVGNQIKECANCEHYGLCEDKDLPVIERACNDCLLWVAAKMTEGFYATKRKAVPE